jgi:light-regulated signal transduction histidine kinase (bacteriophytochrome)
VSSLGDRVPLFLAGTEQRYPADRQPIARALRGERAHSLDVELRLPTGRRVPLEVWAAPVHGPRGNIALAVAAFSDMTEQRDSAARIARLNRDLTGAVTELRDLNQELEAFAYSVSHDLRAPIRHIDGFARLLGERLTDHPDDRIHHYLGRVLDGAKQMGQLIDDLLHLSRVTRQNLAVTPTDLNALLRNVVYELREETRNRTIEWRVDRLPRMPCDPGLTRLVFANLLANAVKFTRPRDPAVIEVGQQSAADTPVLFVRDNGVGFDMRHADKLFGVFQRLHHLDEFDGTGVGLATVQRIIHKHGGRIWAESELDKGATFYFTFGRRDEERT